jgi:hypothetical protein
MNTNSVKIRRKFDETFKHEAVRTGSTAASPSPILAGTKKS